MTDETQPAAGIPQPVAAPATPIAERPDGALQVASLRRRLPSCGADTMVAYGLAYLLTVALLLITFTLSGSSLDSEEFDTLGAVVVIGMFLTIVGPMVWYFVALPARQTHANGQLIAGRGMDLRYVKDDGSAYTLHAAAIRYFLPWAITLIPLVVGLLIDELAGSETVGALLFAIASLILLAGYVVVPFFGDRRQTLIDRLSRTVVVEAAERDPRPLPGGPALPIHGRPKTGSTWALLAGAIAAVLIFFAMFAVIADREESGSFETTSEFSWD